MHSPIYRTPEGEQMVMDVYEQALARWPVACEQRAIDTRVGPTFVVAFGNPNARPLILLHGAASNSSMWAPLAPDYAAWSRVYAVDLPGEAGKSTPNRPLWRGTAFADWLGDVLDGLGLQSAMIGGISQGAWAAMKFATVFPSRVERLVLTSPAGVIPDRRSFVFRAIPYAFMRGWGARRITQMVFAPVQPPPGSQDGAVFMQRHFKPRVGIVPVFADAELRMVTMPTLLAGGDHDALRDVARIERRLSPFLPGLELELIPGAGHATMPSSTRVVEFLNR